MMTHSAILFVDIAGSTALYERFGNDAAKRLVTSCLDLLREEVHRYGGEVVQAVGDELMCRFPKAGLACETAIAMQRRIASCPVNRPVPVKIRIGFDWGEALSEGNNLYGDAVNTASRLAHIAKGGQIMTSERVIGAAGETVRGRCRDIGSLPLKGKKRPLNVCEILWESVLSTDHEMASTMLTRAPLRAHHLHLAFGDSETRMTPDTRPLTLGRDSENDVVIPYPEVSRFHATIEWRMDKYYLEDHSANGTTVIGLDGIALVLRREEAPLSGRGQILCGVIPPTEEGRLVVQYATHESNTLEDRP
jgi:hypothetical protein